eukprot:s603_g33.t1
MGMDEPVAKILDQPDPVPEEAEILDNKPELDPVPEEAKIPDNKPELDPVPEEAKIPDNKPKIDPVPEEAEIPDDQCEMEPKHEEVDPTAGAKPKEPKAKGKAKAASKKKDTSQVKVTSKNPESDEHQKAYADAKKKWAASAEKQAVVESMPEREAKRRYGEVAPDQALSFLEANTSFTMECWHRVSNRGNLLQKVRRPHVLWVSGAALPDEADPGTWMCLVGSEMRKHIDALPFGQHALQPDQGLQLADSGSECDSDSGLEGVAF